jgi:Kazal-type serine protease inhibitor domain
MKTGFVVSLAAALALAMLGAGAAQAVGPGKACGGFPGIQCDAGLFCQQKPGACRIVDMSGTCVRIPQICPMIVLPVCGCNNVTYNNACEAAKASVSILHNGRC